MLQSLHIQNYALIEKLDIDFECGFSVITGETGAGKSIILGAIGLLLGQRADTKLIKNGASRCVIEAHFDLRSYDMESYFLANQLEYDNGECILRRELLASGKSRAFINDVPASLAQMKELGERLIDIHSQHQNLLFGKEDFQLSFIDIIADNRAQVEEYGKAYQAYKAVSEELELLTQEAIQRRADEDYLRFQLQQIDELQLASGEQTKLEQELEQLTHAEDIKHSLYAVSMCLNSEGDGGILSLLKEGIRHLRDVERVYIPAQELQERMQSCHIELKDIADEIERGLEQTEFSPDRLDFINERLGLIYNLEQKHRLQTDEQLLELAEDMRTRLEAITSYDERIGQLTVQRDATYAHLLQLGRQLTEVRKKTASHVEQQMKEHLVPLGMPNVDFKIEFVERDEPNIRGLDKVNFLFSANKNVPLQKISQVASGGEIARVMLSVKAMTTGVVKLPTIIFDEIDTGVSGKIAERMAYIMFEMGRNNRQVISITHLPQIAALGQHHYRVYKHDNEQGTTSHLVRLSSEERILEIAHMLSGEELTEAAVNNAKELLRKTELKAI